MSKNKYRVKHVFIFDNDILYKKGQIVIDPSEELLKTGNLEKFNQEEQLEFLFDDSSCVQVTKD